MTPQHLVAAITVNWRRPKETVRCIHSLKNGGIENLRIIVVDNGSGADDVNYIRNQTPDVEILVMNSNVGYAKGINAGIVEASKGNPDYILVMNNDAYGAPGFLSRMIEGFRSHPRAGIVGPKILYQDGKTIWYAGGAFNRWFGYSRHLEMDSEDIGYREDKEVDFVTGCAMLVKREVFDEVGLFDEEYEMYVEDLDLCLRAQRRGYELWYIPSAIVYHEVSSSLGIAGTNTMTPFKAYRYARNMFLLIEKNMMGLKFLTCIIGQFVISLPYFMMLIALQRSEGAHTAYLKGVVCGLKYIIKRR
ncbi:MAG: glycosyltransferase family 2 protein [Methanomassiliicoccales archaeon]